VPARRPGLDLKGPLPPKRLPVPPASCCILPSTEPLLRPSLDSAACLFPWTAPVCSLAAKALIHALLLAWLGLFLGPVAIWLPKAGPHLPHQHHLLLPPQDCPAHVSLARLIPYTQLYRRTSVYLLTASQHTPHLPASTATILHHAWRRGPAVVCAWRWHRPSCHRDRHPEISRQRCDRATWKGHRRERRRTCPPFEMLRHTYHFLGCYGILDQSVPQPHNSMNN
jgi:hypothetical protein